VKAKVDDVCAFGVPWLEHFTRVGCLFCAAEGDRLEAQFAADVASGKYDDRGYTAADRRARSRKPVIQADTGIVTKERHADVDY
jgi:hypothetical protein